MYRKSIGQPQRFLIKRLHRQWLAFWHTYKKWITIVSIVLGGLIIVQIILRAVIYAERYQVQKIIIHHTDNSTVDQDLIEDMIRSEIVADQSYITLRRSKRSESKNNIIHNFPLIESIELSDFANNTLKIDVSYHHPRIIRHLANGIEFGSYDEYIYQLSTGYVIAHDPAILYLPGYLAGLSSLDGIYHLTSEQDLTKIYHTVNQQIPLKHMIVYPGAGYVAMMTVDDLKVLFSLRKPIENQMQLYSDIYHHYTDAHRIRQIDVGSLDDAIVTLE